MPIASGVKSEAMNHTRSSTCTGIANASPQTRSISTCTLHNDRHIGSIGRPRHRFKTRAPATRQCLHPPPPRPRRLPPAVPPAAPGPARRSCGHPPPCHRTSWTGRWPRRRQKERRRTEEWTRTMGSGSAGRQYDDTRRPSAADGGSGCVSGGGAGGGSCSGWGSARSCRS